MVAARHVSRVLAGVLVCFAVLRTQARATDESLAVRLEVTSSVSDDVSDVTAVLVRREGFSSGEHAQRGEHSQHSLAPSSAELADSQDPSNQAAPPKSGQPGITAPGERPAAPPKPCQPGITECQSTAEAWFTPVMWVISAIAAVTLCSLCLTCILNRNQGPPAKKLLDDEDQDVYKKPSSDAFLLEDADAAPEKRERVSYKDKRGRKEVVENVAETPAAHPLSYKEQRQAKKTTTSSDPAPTVDDGGEAIPKTEAQEEQQVAPSLPGSYKSQRDAKKSTTAALAPGTSEAASVPAASPASAGAEPEATTAPATSLAAEPSTDVRGNPEEAADKGRVASKRYGADRAARKTQAAQDQTQ